MAAVIETVELRKIYGKHEAVRGLNLAVQSGSVCAFLGQNGAGKSSTIKMLLGMIHPTSGSGSIFGHRIDREKASLLVRRKVAFVAEDKRLYDYMTVAQIVRFTKSFFRAGITIWSVGFSSSSIFPRSGASGNSQKECERSSRSSWASRGAANC